MFDFFSAHVFQLFDFSSFISGVFPYDFASSLDVLHQAKSLPPKSAFYNSLHEEEISDEDYEHAREVFDSFNCQSMLDYMVLYMKSDVALLADNFLTFRDLLFEQFKLDPCHFISLPSYSFNAMLSYTGVEIEEIDDIDIFNFLGQNIRGGFSFIHERFAEHTEEQFLLYVDANNLYGYAQSLKLPIGDYEFMSPEDIRKYFKKMLRKYTLEGDEGVGFIAEVDLEYPKELHEIHKSFPLAPCQTSIPHDHLSPYQKKCHEVLGTRQSKTTKLMGTFYKREKYVLHAANLKLYLKLGMKLTKVYKVLKFKESRFLKPYIDLCTALRSASISDFEKRTWKLVLNSCFGKFLEQAQKFVECVVCTTAKEFERAVSNPRFLNYLIISKNLVVVFLER